MDNNNRTVIVGLDGVPYDLLNHLADAGIMPFTKKLISGGTFRKMQSTVPEVSSVAWSSIITGVNPAEHGIFGFTDLALNTYRLTFPNFDDLRCSPFWHRNQKARYVIINTPSTYPARALNGILISGFVALRLERAVYPESVIPDLKSMGYKIDVDSQKAHESLELFIKDLKNTNEARIAAYRHFWTREWDVFMFVFTGTDRLMHFLWDSHEDKKQAFYQEFMDYFKRIDEIVGEMLCDINDKDNFVMLSDHGFEKLEKDVYVNNILQKEEFLKLPQAAGADGRNFNISNMDYSTRAFALEPSRIYINLIDKYPRGNVTQKDREYVIRDIEDLFKDLECDDEKVIARIYRKEEIYEGPHLDRAPDLALVGNKGFNLKASLVSKEFFSKDIFTGKHTRDNAFLLVNRRCGENVIPIYPNVRDVIGIINRLNGGDE